MLDTIYRTALSTEDSTASRTGEAPHGAYVIVGRRDRNDVQEGARAKAGGRTFEARVKLQGERLAERPVWPRRVGGGGKVRETE